MFALPSILRVIVPHQVQRDKLTGSQRQRGMYMNAGRLILENTFFTFLMMCGSNLLLPFSNAVHT